MQGLVHLSQVMQERDWLHACVLIFMRRYALSRGVTHLRKYAEWPANWPSLKCSPFMETGSAVVAVYRMYESHSLRSCRVCAHCKRFAARDEPMNIWASIASLWFRAKHGGPARSGGARAFAGMVKERLCRFRTAPASKPKIGRVVFPGYKDLTSGNALLRKDHALCWEK